MPQLLFIKCGRSLLQNASGFLVQNATVIENCDDFITKYDVYYKLRQYSAPDLQSFLFIINTE